MWPPIEEVGVFELFRRIMRYEYSCDRTDCISTERKLSLLYLSY
jgi:hypothetical protein